MFVSLVILCLATVPMALCENIHQTMSVAQLSEIFQKNHHSLVPDYEVVQFQIPRRNKRDIGEPEALITTAFGGNVHLWLDPGSGILSTRNTPVYAARTINQNGNIHYRQIPDAMRNLGQIYQDHRQGATLLVNKNSRGQYLVDGFIGTKNLVVRSLPESISNNLMDNDTSNKIEQAENSTHEKSAYHVVFKGTNYSESALSQWNINDPKYHQDNFYNQNNVFYPELMIVVDYDLYLTHGSNLQRILSYIVTFWNGVDLMYRSLNQPAIRFNIARIIVAEDRRATPYIAYNTLYSGFVDHQKAWKSAEIFFYRQLNVFPANSYDAVITMTSRHLADNDGLPKILGVATIGGVCQIDDRSGLVLGVGITMDDGSFRHVITAAHEFGHLLNANHDGLNNHCPGQGGYIMGAVASVTQNYHDFSQCSIAHIAEYIRNNQASCMSNRPDSNEPLPRILPGQFINRHQQCAALGWVHSCYDSSAGHSPCDAIYCVTRKNPIGCYKSTMTVPAEGAPCGNGGICIHGYCTLP